MQEHDHHDAASTTGATGMHEHGTPREEQERARRHLSDVTERVRSEASRAGDVGRKRSAEMLRSVSRAAHDGGDGSASPPDAISRVLGDAADYVEHADLRELGTEAVRVARRHPAAVMSGLAILGFAAGRVLSARPPASDHDGRADGRESGGDEGRSSRRAPGARAPRGASVAEPSGPGSGPGTPSPLDPAHRPDPVGTRPAHRP